MNLQNQPTIKEYRAMFEAAPGYKLVVADMSSIEMRILADFSNEKLLLDAFERGRDPHIFAASLLEGISYADLEELVNIKDPIAKEQRNAGKTFNYSTLYRQTVYGLAKKIGITEQKAESLQLRYNANFRQIEPWSQRIIKQALAVGYVRTASGRIRYLPKIKRFKGDTEAVSKQRFESMAVNTVIQGTAGDCMKESMVIMLPLLKKYDALLLAQIHDEVVVMVLEAYAEAVREIVVKSLIAGHRQYLKSVKIEVDSHIVDNWGQAK